MPAWMGVERWQHPIVGALTLAYENLQLPGPEEQRLLIYVPYDEAAAAALATLIGTAPATNDAGTQAGAPPKPISFPSGSQ